MPKKRKPEPWEVTAEDIEREKQRLLDNKSKFPALSLIVDKLPDGYDPEMQPETHDQVKFRNAVIGMTERREVEDILCITDPAPDIFVQYKYLDDGLYLDVPHITPQMPRFGAWVDMIHDLDLKVIDNEPYGYQVNCGLDGEKAFRLGLAALKCQGAIAHALDVNDMR